MTGQDTRSYQTREIEDKMLGIIVRISIPLSSGRYARKEYSYPRDLLKKKKVNWFLSQRAHVAIGLFKEAFAARDSGEDKTAHDLFIKSYEKDPSVRRGAAAYGLMRLYYYGSEGVLRDRKLAAEWKIKAANEGHPLL